MGCDRHLFAVLAGNGVFMNIYYHKKLGLNMFTFWKTILKTLPACGLSVMLGLLLLQILSINSWTTLFLYIGCYCVIYGASVFFLGLYKEERTAILGKFKKA